MPNLCNYSMKIVGSKESVMTLIDYLKCDYLYHHQEDKHYNVPENIKDLKYHYCKDGVDLYMSAKKHFYRIFDVWDREEGKEPKEREDGLYEKTVDGDCAWSVSACMLSGKNTYYSDNNQEVAIGHATCLEEATKELNLKVEIYSEEPGNEFAEHYLIDNGNFLINHEYEYREIDPCCYDSKEEAEEALEESISDEEWNSGELIVRTDMPDEEREWTL